MSRSIAMALAASTAFAASGIVCAQAAAQDGAYDADPYFSTMPAKQQVYSGAPPRRATAGQTQESVAPAPLPRPRSGQQTAMRGDAASYPAAANQARTSVAPPPARVPAAARTISAYAEARTGWDGLRGSRRDDGIILGATAGFDGTIARLAGGRLYAGLFGSIDFSSARRTPASVERDETGFNPVLTLTENPVSETRDLELGTRLGWRTNRFGVYAMAALTNAKRETDEVVTVFTELNDPDNPDSVVFTRDSVTSAGKMGFFDDGWRIGAGAEARLIGPAYMHLGYRYSNYSGGAEKHQVLTGLGARF